MPFNDRNRYLAMRRAVRMNKLFKEAHFDAIMGALYLPEDAPGHTERKDAFYTACGSAGLDPVEKDWLWNYLQHCNQTGFPGHTWRDLPEAAEAEEPAQTGW
jgi:hypothetical protein